MSMCNQAHSWPRSLFVLVVLFWSYKWCCYGFLRIPWFLLVYLFGLMHGLSTCSLLRSLICVGLPCFLLGCLAWPMDQISDTYYFSSKTTGPVTPAHPKKWKAVSGHVQRLYFIRLYAAAVTLQHMQLFHRISERHYSYAHGAAWCVLWPCAPWRASYAVVLLGTDAPNAKTFRTKSVRGLIASLSKQKTVWGFWSCFGQHGMNTLSFWDMHNMQRFTREAL